VLLVVVLAVRCRRRRELHGKNKCSSGHSSVTTSGGNVSSTASISRQNSHQNSHHGHLHNHLNNHYGTAQRRPSSHQQYSSSNGRIQQFQDDFDGNGILPVGPASHHHLDPQVRHRSNGEV
jgi:hypothetical protein